MDDAWLEKLAIQELCSRYCHTIDAQDAAGWAGCFTPDGAFEFGDTDRLVSDPEFQVNLADPDVAELVQHLVKAARRLAQPA